MVKKKKSKKRVKKKDKIKEKSLNGAPGPVIKSPKVALIEPDFSVSDNMLSSLVSSVRQGHSGGLKREIKEIVVEGQDDMLMEKTSFRDENLEESSKEGPAVSLEGGLGEEYFGSESSRERLGEEEGPRQVDDERYSQADSQGYKTSDDGYSSDLYSERRDSRESLNVPGVIGYKTPKLENLGDSRVRAEFFELRNGQKERVGEIRGVTTPHNLEVYKENFRFEGNFIGDDKRDNNKYNRF
jgi:hypothetical protein